MLKKNLILVLSIIFISNLISAVTITNSTLYSDSKSYQIYINDTLSLTRLLLTSTAIEIHGTSSNTNLTNNGAGNCVLNFYTLGNGGSNNDIKWDNGTIIDSPENINLTIASGRYINLGDFITDETPSIISGGIGSGSTPSNLGLGNISSYLCNRTYEFALKKEPYSKIDNLIKEIKNETGEEYQWGIIKKYIDNWQILCSDLTRKTLYPIEMCEKVFLFLVDNKFKLDEEDANIIGSELKNNVSGFVVTNYAENYDELCYDTGFYQKLPLKESVINILKKSIDKYYEGCELKDGGFFSISIPLPKKEIEKDVCDGILKYFFRIRTLDGKLYLDGIRFWVVFWVVFIALIYSISPYVFNNKKNY